ncbi:hypothetical protein N9R34_01355 [Candidatus Thioglobus sp.]|nr:hypothetical protein [Candidatus Thioglobus sp.]MDB4099179.1 hypothetical protein [Candidatus Thioglobus sp.]
MKRLTTTLLIFLFSISSANAGTVIGYLTCGSFLDSCDKSKNDIDCWTQTYFALGYISANAVAIDISLSDNAIDRDNIKYALIKYCRANPFKDTHLGAVSIFNQIK